MGLGCALQRQGFDVRLACNPAMQALASRAALKVIPFGEKVGPGEAATRPSHWDHWLQPPELVVWNERYIASASRPRSSLCWRFSGRRTC